MRPPVLVPAILLAYIDNIFNFVFAMYSSCLGQRERARSVYTITRKNTAAIVVVAFA